MLGMLYTWIVVSLWTFRIHGQSIQHRITSTGIVAYGSNIRTKRHVCTGSLYCGHEKSSWKTIDNQSVMPHDLYRYCSDGVFLFLRKCKNRCQKSADSYCITCSPGSEYCGYELRNRGYNRSLPTGEEILTESRYLCSGNGEDVTLVPACHAKCGCIPSDKCIPGRRYCTDELLELENEINKNIPTETIWHCTNHTGAIPVQQCEHGCVSDNDTPRCVPKCKPFQLYCGWELWEFGWSGGNPNHLYQCTERGRTILVTTCGATWKYAEICRNQSNINSTCVEKCNPGQEYCGRDLVKLDNWTYRVTVDQQRHIQRCTNGSSIKQSRSCPDGCSSIGQKPYCLCKVGVAYCGHELQQLKWPQVQANSLYRCNGENNITEVETCTKCHRAAPNSYCSMERCVDGSFYCGSQLQRSKFDLSFNSDGIYGCRNSKAYFTDRQCLLRCVPATKTKALYCSKECDPGVYYCGFELQVHDWNVNSQGLYYCRNKTFAEPQKICLNQCVASWPRSHCGRECVPGQLYCGHELHQLGFSDGVARNLYRCTNGTVVILNETCTGDCEVVDNETSHCVSTPLGPTRMDCGTQFQVLSQQSQVVPLIRDGSDSERGWWPWTVSILYNGRHNCGGTLIKPQWVLSAAHCFDYTQTGTVVLGNLNTLRDDEKGQVKVEIDRVRCNPGYTTTSIEHDIALVRLKKPVQYSRYIRPACLPSSDQEVNFNTTCVIPGWGYTLGEELPDKLQEVEITIVSNDTCLPKNGIIPVSRSGRRFPFTEDMICAAPVREKQGLTCRGDSGGPLLCKQGSTWIVQGITSYGDSKACHPSFNVSNMHSVFTRVSSYLSWIEQEMRNLP